jgi:dTDP-glucose pyrophosphorylase
MQKEEIVGLVPAAGGGTRLYPFSRAVPKEMYPILGKAVIEHNIENLRKGGIKKIFMIVGFQKGALMDYIGDGSFYGIDVAYIYQLKRMGLGHAILQAKHWIDTTFVTLLGDSFIEPKEEIKDLIDYHMKKKPIATVLLFKVKDPTGYGIVRFKKLEGDHGPIEKLIEKPTPDQAKELKSNDEYYAITGAYVFEPKIFDYIEKTKPGIRNEVQITDSIALALKNGENVQGVILKGEYIDIGKWNTVLKIEKRMIKDSDIESHIKERENLVEKILKFEEEERKRNG